MKTKIFKRIFLIIFFICFLVLPCSGDENTNSIDIKSILDPIKTKYNIPGMGACVIYKSEILALDTVGVRKYGNPEAVTCDDQFHLGSCTKAITATLIAKLVEEGKLRWKDTLGELFPELKSSMHPKYRKVTFVQLLTHRGGFPERSWPKDMTIGDLYTLTGTMTEQRLFFTKKMCSETPEKTPGTQYIYSNTGYVIAGTAAEKVTGKSWEELVKEYIFTPLGMKTAGFGSMGTPGKIEEPWQHELVGEIIRPIEPGPYSDNPLVLGPAGTIHCSLRDWAQFIILHMKGEAGKSRFLKYKTFKKLHTPIGASDYAMGWIVTVREWGGGDVLTHAGSNTRNWSVVWMAPKKDFAVLVTANFGGDVIYKAIDKAAGLLIGKIISLMDL